MLFRGLLFGMDGANNDGEDAVIGTLGKGGLKELDGEPEWHSVQSQSDDLLECDSSDSDVTISFAFSNAIVAIALVPIPDFVAQYKSINKSLSFKSIAKLYAFS